MAHMMAMSIGLALKNILLMSPHHTGTVVA